MKGYTKRRRTVICPHCRGRRKIKMTECQNCKGKGKLVMTGMTYVGGAMNA